MTHIIQFRRSRENIVYESPQLSPSGNAFMPTTAFVPLIQHKGLPARAVVSPGETVREGQLIARGTGPESANVHSPIPGIVREFRRIPLPDGSMGEAACIELAGSFGISGRREERNAWKNIGPSEILRILEDRGIVNTFGETVPLAPQLRSALKAERPAIVLRLFDRDPTCGLDESLARHFTREVLEGTAIIARAISAETVCLIDVGKKWRIPDGIDKESIFGKTNVVETWTTGKYPSGNESQVRSQVTARCPELMNRETVYIDPSTAVSAYDSIVRNQPALYRHVLILGPAIGKPAFLKVKIGTSIGDLIEECGGVRTQPSRIIVNGLLTGTAIYDLDTPVTKYTKSFHLMDRESCPDFEVKDCIHCGRCLQVCPVRIDPMRTVTAIRKERVSAGIEESIEKCQGCGCCAIVCPSRIPLHHIIRASSKRNGGKGK
ncbi:MAG TPA: 4Fe-4S dicluster domain-containing protein [Treponemataceae bacterium]|nr:4Fe-4S dicluster domain-containing protein [Treponemataceae bacterium]